MVSINYWDIVQKAISIALGFYFGLVFFFFFSFVRSILSFLRCRCFYCSCFFFFFFFSFIFCWWFDHFVSAFSLFSFTFYPFLCTHTRWLADWLAHTLHYCHISCCDFSWFDCSVGFADGRYHMSAFQKWKEKGKKRASAHTHTRHTLTSSSWVHGVHTYLIADVFDSH